LNAPAPKNSLTKFLSGLRPDALWAVFAVVFMALVAITKTLVTKGLFSDVDFEYPVVYSGISCVATDLMILPLFATGISKLEPLKRMHWWGFLLCCALTAVDMGCMNLALNELSVSVQQALKASTPVLIILLEYLLQGKRHSTYMIGCMVPLTMGPLMCAMGSKGGDVTLSGIIFMLGAIVSGAAKVVFLHKVIGQVKSTMSMVSVLFWMDLLMLLFVAPWAVANGEISQVGSWEHITSWYMWAMVFGVGVMGGVRAYSINLVLKYTSALTKVATDVFVQAATITLSIWIFSTSTSPLMIAGVLITVGGYGCYSAVKYHEKQLAKGLKKASISDKLGKEEVEGLLGDDHSPGSVGRSVAPAV